MMNISPVNGGQYRFAYTNDKHTLYIGVFYNFCEFNLSCDIDLYVEGGGTPLAENFVSLLGLPDLKRHNERTRRGVLINDISIINKLYIIKNSLFLERLVQWRFGMRNLYRIGKVV